MNFETDDIDSAWLTPAELARHDIAFVGVSDWWRETPGWVEGNGHSACGLIFEMPDYYKPGWVVTIPAVKVKGERRFWVHFSEDTEVAADTRSDPLALAEVATTAHALAEGYIQRQRQR